MARLPSTTEDRMRCHRIATKSCAHLRNRVETDISKAPSSSLKDPRVAEGESSTGQRMMLPSRAGQSGVSKSTACFTPARMHGKMGTAASWGSRLMSQACWGWLQMQIWKVDGYVWQLNAISRHAPNHGKVCRRREEMPPSGRCSGSFHSFSEAEYVTRACHVDDNTTLMLGRRRKNSFSGQRA